MRKKQNNDGFSLGELLVVVAILVILMGLAFVALFQHQRTLTQLEMDGAAKEIFVAAQNHLTLADSQGLLENKNLGQHGSGDIYYFVVDDETDVTNKASALSLMLPFASVDDTIRLGGSYVISYEANSGRVLDVFYSQKSGRFAHTFLSGGETFDSLLENLKGDDKKEARKSYQDSKAVIGWYGGDGLEMGKALKKPTIQIINAEQREFQRKT